MKYTRREILNGLLGFFGLGFASSVIYPVAKFLNPPKVAEPKISKVKAGSAKNFKPESFQIVKFGRKPVILIKQGDGKFLAFSASCTHLDCIVHYSKDAKQIICACHNGKYDLRGRNISGPPPKPLDEFTVKVIDDEIIITA